MTTYSLPAPSRNLTNAGVVGRADDIIGNLKVAAGDYTGGAAANMFTLSDHGLSTGTYVHLLYKSAVGAVNGRTGSRFKVKVLSSSTFQLTTDAGVVVENSADGTAVFLPGAPDAATASFVNVGLLPNLVVVSGDYTGGSTEDMFAPSPTTGRGMEDGHPLVLLYKAAAGVVTDISPGTTVYAKTVTSAKFELSATAGGADIENTADGLAIFLQLA